MYIYIQSSGVWVPGSTGFSRLGECSRNPSISVYQLALLWEAAFSFSEFFADSFNVFAHFTMSNLLVHLPSTMSVQQFLTQNTMTPVPHPPYSPNFAPINFFFFVSLMKKVLKGKHFADEEEMKQKMAEALKGVKINKVKSSWAMGKNVLIGVLYQVESILKVTDV